MKRTCCLLISILLMGTRSIAQEIDTTMSFESYDPISTLVVPEHHVYKAKFPFIDVHNHQPYMAEQDLSDLVTVMDTLNMAVMINLSGRSFVRTANGFEMGKPAKLKEAVDNVKAHYPNRFLVFTNIDFKGIGQDGWTEKAVKELEKDYENGARGLKIYKSLGFSVTDTEGNRVTVDDPRLDPLWAKAGELKMPVLIHTADPKPFWDDINGENERWLELKLRPGRKRSAEDPAPWDTLMAEQHNVFRKHPETTFINAHMGWYANNLDKLASLMEEFPNMYVEIGAIIAELGRQPKRAKQFFEQYQDRILFGKDSWVPSEYETYFRVLETEDEYFPYHKKYHAFWRMYGLGLSDDILKKVYYKNALTLFPDIDKSLFPVD